MTQVTGPRGPFQKEQLSTIHEATLAVLERTGLRVDCPSYHDALESAGARVDRDTGVIRFPSTLVEQTIESLRKEISAGRRQYMLNGVTNPLWTPPAGCKFGGACIEYLDPETDDLRPPTEQDLIRLLQLGEALDSVGFVGNPVACLLDATGNNVPGPMQRIKTAALVAKYTTKCGSTEVWNERELEFLIEIGEIVRGSREGYQAQPCFVTAKETIDPLQFPAEDGSVLLMLAQRDLPCTIVPMPITGATCPSSIASNIVMANAEILGVMTCLRAAVPGAMVAGGVISGIMDMSSGLASFSAPETLLQDAGLAQLYDNFYGQDLAIGTGYIDAQYPGGQSMTEKTSKMQAAAEQGRFNFPVGLLAGGKRFSPVEAVLELEIAESISRLYKGIDTTENLLALDVIEEVGIGGEFISHEHTYEHFRDIWMPKLYDRRAPDTIETAKAGDMIQAAKEKALATWKRDDLYQIDEERSKAIDDVVARAEQVLR
ncbi:MAG: trimethylamine methyltransferase family protein [Armatimonadota bacterium]